MGTQCYSSLVHKILFQNLRQCYRVTLIMMRDSFEMPICRPKALASLLWLH